MRKSKETKIIWGFMVVAMSPFLAVLRYRRAKKLANTLNFVAFCHSSKDTRERCRLWIEHNLGGVNTRAIFFNLHATERYVARFWLPK